MKVTGNESKLFLTKSYYKSKPISRLHFLIIVVLFLGGQIASFAQTNYTYDPAGNRTRGTIYVGPPSNERSFAPVLNRKDMPEPDEIATHLAMDYGISIFPTVISDILSITIATANENNPALVEVFDNLGKSVYNIKVNSSSQGQINFSSIKNGMYNIKVSIKNKNVFYKVIKGK